MSAQLAPIEVFLSYAEADEPLCIELERHLRLLEREGLVITWHRGKIEAGARWSEDIDHHLSRASIIVLLLSANFVNSDYCYGVEMRRAVERHEAGEAYVIPVELRSMDRWHDTPWGKLQTLPSNGVPVTSWSNWDDAFSDIAKGIRSVVKHGELSPVVTPPVPLPSIWNIPYPRNAFFTGRDELLDHLSTLLKTGRAMVLSQALIGLGGIGKTQVAVEYAYRYRQDYQAVLWTQSDTHEALVSGFVAIAGLLNLPEKDEQDQIKAVEAVKRWFTTHTGWLLICDNVEDLALMDAFLPPVLNGHLVLTTRAQATGRRAERIEVDCMPVEVGTLFLLRRAKLIPFDGTLRGTDEASEREARAICTALGGLPLALDQAGAYIEETDCSLSHYFDLFKQKQKYFLDRRGRDSFDHRDSVAITFSLAIEKVQQKNKAAIELLSFCSYLAPDLIPLELIEQGAPYLGGVLKDVSANALQLYHALEILRMYSLVRRDGKNRTLSMHRLVQAVLRDTMDGWTKRMWVERTMQVFNNVFPEGHFENWPQCERYLSHALVCAELIEQEQIRVQEVAVLLTLIGEYLGQRGRYAEAESLLQRAMTIHEEQGKTENLYTAFTANTLAWLYWSQGRDAEAEPLHRWALEIREKILGPYHPVTAMSLNNLGSHYANLGKYAEAELLHRRVLGIREKTLGPYHPSTAESLNNLALAYKNQGKYAEAEPLYRRALEIREKVRGPHHPDTAASLNNLAMLYYAQGKYTEAEALAKRVLAIREQQLGEMHPDTANSLHNLAGIYSAQGKYAEAEPLYKRLLEIREQHPDPEYMEITDAVNRLARCLSMQGKYLEAEPLYSRALEIKEQQLGGDHLDTATGLNNLAMLYHEQGKYEQAESLLPRALAIFERQLGADHHNTAFCLGNLAELYRVQGRYEEAEPLFLRALEVCERELGEHPHTASILHNLACLYASQCRYGEAELLFLHALAIRERQMGTEHPHTASSLNCLAQLYYDQGRYEEAEPLFLHALAICEQQLGTEHPHTVASLNSLALLYTKQNKYEEAEPLFLRVLMIREEVLGAKHPDTASSLNALASLYAGQGRHEEAEPLFRRALDIREEVLGAEHFDIARRLALLEDF